MAKARIELYKDGDHMAIVTNAEDEHDFWESPSPSTKRHEIGPVDQFAELAVAARANSTE